MKVLITGAAGFIGRVITEHLIGRGEEIIALDKKPLELSGSSKNIIADIGTASLAERIADEIECCDAVIHTAAVIDMSPFNSDIALVNCLGTQQLLYFAKMKKVASFIFISSVPVIGTPRLLPITEEHPTNPPTAYHASKLYGEYLVQIASADNLQGTILRLTSPVGLGMPNNKLLSTFVKRSLENSPLYLLGRGMRQQNYVDVRDIAIAVEKCLHRQIPGIFNIAGRNCISNLELAQRCIQILKSSSAICYKEAQDPEEGFVWDVSIKKAEKYLEYSPQHTIEDTITTLGLHYAASIH
jgi:nucleoside-diphosphate-sugar epimerase